MLCAQCRQALQPIVAPAVMCSQCSAPCLSGVFPDEVQVSVQVPAEPGAGRPFGVKMAEHRAGDGRRVLVVPPVAAPPGAALDLAVPRLQGGGAEAKLGGEECHLEVRVVGIRLPSSTTPPQGQPPSSQPQGSIAGAGGALLKSMAAAAVGTLAGVAGDVLARAAGQTKPMTQLLPSNVQYVGPVGLAAKSATLTANVQCGACGSELKAGSTTTIFRCGCCGVLATFAALQGETVYTVRAPARLCGAGFEFETPDGRLAWVEWPVRDMGGRQLTVAVAPKGANLGDLLLTALGAGLVGALFILDPVGTTIDAAVDRAVDRTVCGREPDCKGRVIGVQG